MTIDTNELRARAKIIEPGFPRLAREIIAACDELDRVTEALATAPHSTLCRYMVDHFQEPCSCWKADPAPLFAVSGATSITYGDVRRLTIAGPHGPVLTLPRVGSVHVELDGDRLTVHYDNPEMTT